MPKNRKAAEDFILKNIEALIPGSPNVAMYIDLFKNMSDAQFDTWINDLNAGKQTLNIVVPNGQPYKLDVRRNLALAKKLGHEFFQRIWLTPKNGGSKYLTPDKHLVYKLPVRRQAQLLVKKISIPKDNNVVDVNTGQPTGDSKGGTISYMELQILAAKGLDKTAREFIKLRGGDEKSFHAMNTFISRNGSVSQAEIKPYEGKVKSTEMLKAYLTSMHLENDL